MQADINYLVKWSDEWQLGKSNGISGFNESKCKVLHLGTNNSKLEYQMNSVTLMTDTAEKDLNITIATYQMLAVNKASGMLGLVKIKAIYCAQPRLDLIWSMVIWSPRYLTDCKEI